MLPDKNQQVFFELLKAGLWGDQVSVQVFKSSRVQDSVDWEKVYQLAQEQSVQGIVLSGLEELRAKDIELNVPKVLLLQWIGEVQMIEQRNKEMNAFIAELIKKLRMNDIYAILVKGQGIAQCYEKPLWRSSGDIDLLLSDSNYDKAKDVLLPLATDIEQEFTHFKHLGMTINGWVVELHGTLHSRLSKRVDRMIDKMQGNVFFGGNVRSWENNGSEWMAFYNLASRYLGMPDLDSKFMVHDSQFDKKADRIMEFVMETGNFGHNRHNADGKLVSLWHKTKDFARHDQVFPLDSIKFYFHFVWDGIKVAMNK